MPHNLRKKRSSVPQKLLCQYVLKHSLTLPDHYIEHAIHNGHHHDNQIPFYDDSNHVAYGWQQMGTLPDFPGLHALVQGTQDNLSRDHEDQLQTWLADERQQAVKPVEPDRFNTYSRCGQGLRYVPSLANPGDRSVQHYADKPNSKPPIDSISTKSEEVGTGSANNRHCLALIPRNVNQKLGMGQPQKNLSSFLKLTGDLRKVQPVPESK